MKRIFFILLILSFSYSHSKTGHRIVGQIAESLLTSKAKQAIEQLLGHSRLAYIGNWADEMRSNPDWKHASSWHYVDLPVGKTYSEVKKNPKGDIIAKIIEFQSTLKSNADQETKANALRFLIHFISDLHQPLHVGNGTDKGGNDVKVTWFGKSSNLHRVWDRHLIEDEELSFSEYSDILLVIYKNNFLDWQKSNLTDWVKESQELHKNVYAIGNGKLSYDYVYTNKALSEQRLAQAGARLAKVLNDLFN